MITRNDIERVLDLTAYAEDGDRIGDVDDVYVDDHTREPKFALVNTGLFGLRSSFVPLQGARVEDDVLRLPYSKDRVKDAPNLDPDGDLDPAQERELFRYYDLEGHGTGIDEDATDTERGRTTDHRSGEAGTGTVGHDTSGPETDDAMTRSEQELHVGRTQHETGRARLRKYVVTDEVTKTVPVQREEVRVEREPVSEGDADAALSGPDLSEEEHEVVLHEEEPVVEKRTVPKERVRLDKEVHTDEREVSEKVAHEEIDVEGAERPGRRG
jgi:uncharacterized protein (TIGR02271 family)